MEMRLVQIAAIMIPLSFFFRLFSSEDIWAMKGNKKYTNTAVETTEATKGTCCSNPCVDCQCSGGEAVKIRLNRATQSVTVMILARTKRGSTSVASIIDTVGLVGRSSSSRDVVAEALTSSLGFACLLAAPFSIDETIPMVGLSSANFWTICGPVTSK